MQNFNFESAFKKFVKNVSADWERQIKENFRTQSFYNKKWKDKSNYPGARQGKNLYKEGDLQRSVQVQENVSTGTVRASAFVHYASIHNQGGTITVTAKMRGFFWAMYYQASGKIKRRKDGTQSQSRASLKLSSEAEYWKSLALMKVGTKIKIPQRQFVGFHHQLDTAIRKRYDEQFKDVEQQITKMLKP